MIEPTPLSRLIRRCRPFLGTYVEITVEGPGSAITKALERAFAAVARVHVLMNVHDPASELSRLNRDARSQPVTVSHWTWRVLKAAQRLASESNGAFDPTVDRADAGAGGGHWRDVVLLAGHRVRFRRAVRLDLSGLAKGFAVDRAVEALRRAGATRGLVNAGGDARRFGNRANAFHLRHPSTGQPLVTSVNLNHAAVATSAPTFSRRRIRGRWVSDLIDPRQRRSLTQSVSVTVNASTCMQADGLTKVVWVLGADATPLLARFRATAWILRNS